MGATAQLKMLDSGHGTRDYFQSLLTAAASIILAGLIMLFATVIRDAAAEHAPGLTAIAGGMLESVMSP
ncbi:MAG TPA: hypothetical protein VF133_15610 [Terriglobales bacterium]